MNKEEFENYKSIIASCRLFKEMSTQEIWKILNQDECEVINAVKDEVLFFDAAYIVLEGTVCVEKSAADKRNIIMTKAEPSAPLNLAVAFSHDGSISRLYADGPCTVLKISGNIIRKAIEEGGKFPVNVMEFLVDRVGFLNKKITTFAGYSSGSRLNMYLAENAKDGKVIVPGSISSLAETLGVGRASLYRSLDALEKDGIIVRKGREITIIGDL